MDLRAQVLCGDCLEVMAGLEPDSVDSIVTDPPYGLSFMGKDWDHGIPGEHFWREALRVAKPGAHLLAFGGTRTFHRLTCAIEDAGWEIRDCIMWVYGSGFPKSLDVSKAIDKAAGAERGEEQPHPTNQCRGGQWCKCQTLDATGRYSPTKHPAITAPATDAARRWSGWGTALKPAWEPIVVARRPLDGIVAENVLKHGTGGMNIEGCRVEAGEDYHTLEVTQGLSRAKTSYSPCAAPRMFSPSSGRFPANLIHDGSDEVVRLFPSSSSSSSYRPPDSGGTGNCFTVPHPEGGYRGHDDAGCNARFFYCAKADRQDRNEGLDGFEEVRRTDGRRTEIHVPNLRTTARRNHHPTVKPTNLMRYLCRLVTPPGGLVLDPFCGSGTTGKAALQEGFGFLGIDISAEYCEIARARIAHVSPASLEEEDKINKDGSGQLRLDF